MLLTYQQFECVCTGIYLYHKGKCIVNGTYIRDTHLQIAGGQNGYVYCVLPGQSLVDGGWYKPNGDPVDCGEITHTDPFLCNATVNGSAAYVSLYLQDDDDFSPLFGGNNLGIETEYKCCLPKNCTDANTNIITINAFERVYIIDSYLEILTDITAIPQLYRVHFIVTGRTNADVKLYYVGNITQQQVCDVNQQNAFNCSVSMFESANSVDIVFDYAVTVEWPVIEMNNTIELSLQDGDHVFLCTAEEGAIRDHNRREKMITVKVPASSPTISPNARISYDTLSIDWSYPLESDTFGFVLNVSTQTSRYILIRLNGSTVNNFSISNLTPSTNYNISVRAFQDILGPSSSLLSIRTANAPKIFSRIMKNTGSSLSVLWKIDSEIDGTTGLQTIAIKCRTQANSDVVLLNISCINDGCDSTGNVSIGPVLAGATYSCLVTADYDSFISKSLTNSVSITEGIPSVPIITSVTKEGNISMDVLHYGVYSPDDFRLVLLIYNCLNVVIDTKLISLSFLEQNVSILLRNLLEGACRFCAVSTNIFGNSRCSQKRDFIILLPSVSVEDDQKRSTDIGTTDHAAMITDIRTMDAMITHSPEVTNSIQSKATPKLPTANISRMLSGIYIILFATTTVVVGVLMICIGFTLGYLCHFKMEGCRFRGKRVRRSSENMELKYDSASIKSNKISEKSTPFPFEEPLYCDIDESLNYCKIDNSSKKVEYHELRKILPKDAKPNTLAVRNIIAFPQSNTESSHFVPEGDYTDYEVMSSGHHVKNEKGLPPAEKEYYI